jgi:hypothetical protein
MDVLIHVFGEEKLPPAHFHKLANFCGDLG